MYKNLLTIKPHQEKQRKNIITVYKEWDSNDGDYIGKHDEIDPEDLFTDQKLIYCLAYITYSPAYNDPRFASIDRNDPIFGDYVPDNEDIPDLYDVISDGDFMCYSDWGACHSLEELNLVYYDENGIPFDITFDDIHKEFDSMTYQEICDKINSL